jgi:hypothetical protein
MLYEYNNNIMHFFLLFYRYFVNIIIKYLRSKYNDSTKFRQIIIFDIPFIPSFVIFLLSLKSNFCILTIPFIPSFVILLFYYKSNFCILTIPFIPLSVILSLPHKFNYCIFTILYIPSFVISTLYDKFIIIICIIP